VFYRRRFGHPAGSQVLARERTVLLQLPYKGTGACPHAPRPACSRAIALAFLLSGCSFSYQLDNLFAKKDELQHTASTRLLHVQSSAEMPPEGDLRVARAAVHEALARGGKDASMPWENPDTGARGTITPLASAYSQNGFTCRDFLASYVREGTEAWLQGAACRAQRGKWEIRDLRLWKST
jgi:surface antigen